MSCTYTGNLWPALFMTYNSYKLKCNLFLCFNWNLQGSFGHLSNLLIYDHRTLFGKWFVFYKTKQIMKQMSTAIKPQGIWTQELVWWKAHHSGLATRDQYLDLYLECFLVTTLTLRNRAKSPLKLREEKNSAQGLTSKQGSYLSAQIE